ncbi:MAG: hypothetical protein WC178_01570 [Candidatus Paceibacterota bacterium]
MKSDFVKEIKKSKKTILVVVSSISFFAILCYILFFLNSAEVTVSSSATLTDSSYQEYQDYISSTNKGIKNLLEGEQLQDIDFYEYEEINVDVPKNENPFAQLF